MGGEVLFCVSRVIGSGIMGASAVCMVERVIVVGGGNGYR